MRYSPDKMFFSVDAVTERGQIAQSYYLMYKFMIKNSREAWFLKEHKTQNLEIGAGNNPMIGMTVAVAVAIEMASK